MLATVIPKPSNYFLGEYAQEVETPVTTLESDGLSCASFRNIHHGPESPLNSSLPNLRCLTKILAQTVRSITSSQSQKQTCSKLIQAMT